MEHNIQSVDHFKDILREAVTHNEKLSLSTKQKILVFKKKLQQYIALVDSYLSRDAGSPDESMWDDGQANDAEMSSLQDELSTIGNELMLEVTKVKNTFS
jgi:hypothetical protein